MPQYVIVYLGGDQPSSPEEGEKHFAEYQEWLSSLGESAVSPMNPCLECGGLISVHNGKCFQCDTITRLVEKDDVR